MANLTSMIIGVQEVKYIQFNRIFGILMIEGNTSRLSIVRGIPIVSL